MHWWSQGNPCTCRMPSQWHFLTRRLKHYYKLSQRKGYPLRIQKRWINVFSIGYFLITKERFREFSTSSPLETKVRSPLQNPLCPYLIYRTQLCFTFHEQWIFLLRLCNTILMHSKGNHPCLQHVLYQREGKYACSSVKL